MLPGITSMEHTVSSVANTRHTDGWHALIDSQCEIPESLSGITLSML